MPYVRDGELVYYPSEQRAQAAAAAAGGSRNSGPSAATALQAATDYTGRTNSALRSASGYASRTAGVGSALQSQGNRLYSQYWDQFSGLVDQLPGMANIPLSTYVNDAANDVAGNYDRERGILQRSMARTGVNPASGRWQNLQGQLARAEAAARAGAMTTARQTGQQQNFQRSLQAGSMGLQVAGMGQSALGQAAGTYGSALSGQMGVAESYGGLANQAGAYAAYVQGLQEQTPQNMGALDAAAGTTTAGTTTYSVPRYLSGEWGDGYQPAGALSAVGSVEQDATGAYRNGYPVWYDGSGNRIGLDDSAWHY